MDVVVYTITPSVWKPLAWEPDWCLLLSLLSWAVGLACACSFSFAKSGSCLCLCCQLWQIVSLTKSVKDESGNYECVHPFVCVCVCVCCDLYSATGEGRIICGQELQSGKDVHTLYLVRELKGFCFLLCREELLLLVFITLLLLPPTPLLYLSVSFSPTFPPFITPLLHVHCTCFSAELWQRTCISGCGKCSIFVLKFSSFYCWVHFSNKYTSFVHQIMQR